MNVHEYTPLKHTLSTAYLRTVTGDISPKSKAHAKRAMAILAEHFDLVGATAEVEAALQIACGHVFSPTPATPKDDVSWVARMATHRDSVENREWLKFVCVTEDYIEATDGHMLARTPNAKGYPEGYYVPFLMERLESVPADWRWPRTARVVDIGRYEKTDDRLLTRASFAIEQGIALKAWTVTAHGRKWAYNDTYMKLAFSHPSKQPPSKTNIFDDGRLRLEWPNGTIVIVATMRF